MKINVIGNGFAHIARPNTSFLVNDEILVDTPQGSLKFMIGSVDFSKIKYILITHFHSDHFMDLHLVWDMIRHEKLPYRVKVIAPKSALSRLVKLTKIIETNLSKKDILKYFQFIEVKAGEQLIFEDYQFGTFEMKHNVKCSLGYTIQESNGKVVGFTGDTAPCIGLEKLIEASNAVFIDTSTHGLSQNHVYVADVLTFHKKYKNKKFFSIHVSDEALKKYKKKLNIPNCGEVVEI